MSNEQEHRITYKAGITRKPSDFLCQDGDLAECINLATDNEELKPVVQPAVKFQYANPSSSYWPAQPASRVLYVHTYNTEKRYLIIYAVSEGSGPWFIKWTNNGSTINDIKDVDGSSDLTFLEPDIKITSVGKILIIAASDGLHYLMWKYDGYKSMGELQKPNVEFKLTDRNSHEVESTIKAAGIYWDDNKFDIAMNGQAAWNDTVIGQYTDLRKKIWQKKKFHGSFCVRAALELQGGGYYLVSNPVFMVNQFTELGGFVRINGSDQSAQPTTMHLYGQELNYKFTGDYTQWTDIIKNVVLFVTSEANIYDTTVDVDCEIRQAGGGNITWFMSGDNMYTHSESQVTSEGELYKALRPVDVSDLKNTIKSGVYYKLCEIGLNGDGEWHAASDHFDTHTLENITTAPRLEEDDFYSHSQYKADLLYSYNSRLNMAGVSRKLFEGFGSFMPFKTPYGGSENSPADYEFRVTIRTDSGDIIVSHTEHTNQIQGIFFYYPDPRAKHVVILKNNSQILNEDLMEHPALNGSYYFAGVSPNMTEPSSATGTIPSVTTNPLEQLPNYIITSEVNNPFVFGKKGYNKVGTGMIIGMCETTMGLSQDSYGRTDLVVFSETGIWGMQVDNTGLFQDIHPFLRDVCVNAKSITKVDWGLFFVSKKGLMFLDEKGAKCVSEMMNGVAFNTSTLTGLATGTEWATIVSQAQSSISFLDYIRDTACFLAYDYIDSRIHIINPNYNFSFIYDMASGTISKNILPSAMKRSVGDYPDYILQGTTIYNGVRVNCIYSFYDKPREDEVAGRSTAFILTRPMKLSGPVTKDSLRQLMNVGTWDKTAGSVVATKLYLSDDMNSWYEDVSRFGTAAKYYRIALFIKMLPTERLSGTILTAQSRRTNNMR